MKTLFMFGAAVTAAGSAQALVAMNCKADSDCIEGQVCHLAPCPASTCDPDDKTCDTTCVSDGWCGVPDEKPPADDLSSCKTDADCGEGYLCQIVGSSGSAGCACPADVPPSDCDCPPPPPPQDFWGCVPKPCAVDADCGEGQECVTIDLGCPVSTPACSPDGNCPEADPVECVNSTTTQCQYKWQGACEVDSDCGAGFACKAMESCACSGGGATPSDGGSGFAPAPPPDEECVCSPTDEKYCELVVTECETDADCAPGLTCGGGAGPVATMPACPDENGDGTCDAAGKMACFDEDGDGICDNTTSTDAPKTCGYAWKSVDGSTGGGEAGEPTMNEGPDGAPVPDTATPGDNDENTDGSEPPVTPGNDGLPTAPNTDDNSSAGGPSSGSSSGGASAGCSAVGGSNPSLLGLLGLALIGLVSRRRAAR